jgi:hypothetical protein
MILYQLRCAKHHEFEAWFRDSATFDAQSRKNAVECPFCGGTEIVKAPMAPRLAKGHAGETTEGQAREVAGKVVQAMAKLRRHVEENCEYVGTKFPEEARRIHYGEAEERGIYGEATREEAVELKEEGVEVYPLPLPRRND